MLGFPCITWAQRQLLPGHSCTQAQLEAYHAMVLTNGRVRDGLIDLGLQDTYEKLFGQLAPDKVVRRTTPAMTHPDYYILEVVQDRGVTSSESDPGKSSK